MPGKDTSVFLVPNRLVHLPMASSRGSEQFLLDHLSYANVLGPTQSSVGTKHLVFRSNEEFWAAVLHEDIRDFHTVTLESFQLVDWYPRSPGLFHTDRARDSRKWASHYVREQTDSIVYDRDGKGLMIEGGIGSVRFKPLQIAGTNCWLWTATSDAYCHSGVPICVPEHLLRDVGFANEYRYTLIGQVRSLPDILETHFAHMARVPQIYLWVDSVREVIQGYPMPIYVTPMVFFIAHRSDRPHEQASVTYVTCRPDDLSELDRAADWLEHYVDEYHGEIITNYDQRRRMFAGVPFSLDNVMAGRPDTSWMSGWHRDALRHVNEAAEDIKALSRGTEKYNIGAIRELLEAAFTPAQLGRFCMDRPRFRPLMNKFAPNASLEQMVQTVIEYCYRRILWDELLSEVKSENPAQYERYEQQIEDWRDAL